MEEEKTDGHVTDNSLEQLVHVGRRGVRLLDHGDNRLPVLAMIRGLHLGAVKVANLLVSRMSSISGTETKDEPGDHSRCRGLARRT